MPTTNENGQQYTQTPFQSSFAQPTYESSSSRNRLSQTRSEIELWAPFFPRPPTHTHMGLPHSNEENGERVAPVISENGPTQYPLVNNGSVERSTKQNSEDTEMVDADYLRLLGDDMNDGVNDLQLIEDLVGTVPTSPLFRMAKQAGKARRAKQKRPHSRTLKEVVTHLNSELQKSRKELKQKNIALQQQEYLLREKDDQITKLTERVRDLDLLEMHFLETSRQEARLAKQKDAARRANMEPLCHYPSQDDNISAAKRARNLTSETQLTFKFSASKSSTPLASHPISSAQNPTFDRGNATHIGREATSHRPSSVNRDRTLEQMTGEGWRRHKDSTLSPTSDFCNTLSSNRQEAAYQIPPCVPLKDHRISKLLPATPNHTAMPEDGPTKRLTTATMDSGYQSIDIISPRNSIDSME